MQPLAIPRQLGPDRGAAKTRTRPGNTPRKSPRKSQVKVGKAGVTKKRRERKNNSGNPKTAKSSPIIKKVEQKTEQIKKTDTKELKRHLYIFKSLTKKA